MSPLARLAVAAALSILLTGFAGAEEPMPAAPAVDEEKEVDEGLQRFGYLAGLARGCVTEDQRSKLEREVLDMHAGIARLMGTDRAFLFASAYGYSTNIQIDVKECAEVLTNYDARVAKHRANQGSTK